MEEDFFNGGFGTWRPAGGPEGKKESTRAVVFVNN